MQKVLAQSKGLLASFKVDKATKNLRAKWKPPIINVKFFRVPFNIWKVMGGQNCWRAPQFFHKLENNICKDTSKFVAAFQIWREDSLCDAQIVYAHFQLFKLKDSQEISVD